MPDDFQDYEFPPTGTAHVPLDCIRKSLEYPSQYSLFKVEHKKQIGGSYGDFGHLGYCRSLGNIDYLDMLQHTLTIRDAILPTCALVGLFRGLEWASSSMNTLLDVSSLSVSTVVNNITLFILI